MNIEDELRGALDVAAPPATTSLEAVLRRGRRRVFAQRAGAVAGVVAVVAGVGLGAGTLTSGPPPASPATAVQLPRVAVERDLDWTRVDVPPQQPKGQDCERGGRTVQPSTGIGAGDVPPEFVARFLQDMRELMPGFKIEPTAVKDGNYKWEQQFDLTDGEGTGSAQLIAGRFTSGSPQTYADDGLWITGDCAPPRRKVLADGTILQLHSVHRFRPDKPVEVYSQAVYAYRHDGLILKIEIRTVGSRHMRPVPGSAGFWEPFVSGRPSLPLTEEQFARFGLAVAEGA
ncbi:hypothetical protein ACIA8G_34410 [Lentzea sp. NPDC051213]|uniref:hypothetical protein n=1 Tax=Lentzea sp. NPDC051213 TaxID=3364126 RepID=UPI00379D530A